MCHFGIVSLSLSKHRILCQTGSQDIQRISSYITDIVETDDFQDEPSSGPREEWMLLAELSTTQSSYDHLENLSEIVNDSRNYTLEQIGNMPTWIQQMKESY